MKTIGLIGGMSWESTAVYYRLINQMTRDTLGGLHSAKLLLWSFDFDEIERLQQAGDWHGAARRLTEAGLALKSAGAQCLVICTNTMHRVAEPVERACGLPLLHIADATAAAIREQACRLPLLLGTRYTMEGEFYAGRLRDRHGIEVMLPEQADRDIVHEVIYGELCQGVISTRSRSRFLQIIERAQRQGAGGVILGCTEISLLMSQQDLDLPVFDSTRLHARASLAFALGEVNE